MRLRDRDYDLKKPLLVGILNLTPDSFSDGGQLQDIDEVLARAEQMLADGADILDLGGESTRPHAQPVTAEEEAARVLPALDALARRLDAPLSIDTRRASVAREALGLGATMVNDVSGFEDPDMGKLVAQTGAAWVLMHMPHAVGQMEWAQKHPKVLESPQEALQQIADDLERIVTRALDAGVQRGQLALDPGLGFGKSVAQNLLLLRPGLRLDRGLQSAGPLARLGLPLYVGPSRKSFLGAITGAPVEDRLGATAAAVTAAVLAGVAFVRVHDVRMMRQVLDVAVAIRDA